MREERLAKEAAINRLAEHEREIKAVREPDPTYA